MNEFDYALRVAELARTTSKAKKIKLAKTVYNDIADNINFVNGALNITEGVSLMYAARFILQIDDEVPDALPDFILATMYYLKSNYE